MSVSAELLCSFELLKPLDSAALKNHIKKGRNKRNSILSSPVSSPLLFSFLFSPSASIVVMCDSAEILVLFCFCLRVFFVLLFANDLAACDGISPELLNGLVLYTAKNSTSTLCHRQSRSKSQPWPKMVDPPSSQPCSPFLRP